ncbi:MAG TPA: transglutaminase domain-containing protein [Chitinophagaceae bacterium]
MKNKFVLLAVTGLLILGCDSQKKYHVVEVDNPSFAPNTAFVGYEDLTSPKFKALKEKYQLDTIFHGETDELKRILLLRNWIRKHIRINDPGPHPGDGSCESILDHALKGSGYHCGHFMVVQNAIMNAYGYVTRCLGAGPGGQDGQDGHHGINEIWLNSYHKWFLSDAKYNSHFEKNGIPLSALEVRDEYLKNKAADITRVKGPGRTPVDYDAEYKLTKEEFARTYAWVEWDEYNTRYTSWPHDSAQLIMYKDEYFINHKWIWDGKPHWAYNTAYMIPVPDRNAIEWTPNTIASKVTIDGNKARIELTSNTPNLKTYQMKETSGGDWKDVSNVVETSLNKDKNEIIFHTINQAGVSGPEHRIVIEKELIQ